MVHIKTQLIEKYKVRLLLIVHSVCSLFIGEMSPWAFVFIQILAYLTVINGLESIFAERNDIDSNGFENSVSSVDPDAYLTPVSKNLIRFRDYSTNLEYIVVLLIENG